MLSAVDLILLTAIVVLTLGVLFSSWRRHPREVFSPASIFALLVLYYVVLGPSTFVFQDTLVFFGTDFKPLLWKGWLASLIAQLSFLAGYWYAKSRPSAVQAITSEHWVLWGACMLFGMAGYGMLYWMLKYGGGLSFLNVTFSAETAALADAGADSVLAVYLLQFVNLSFGAACLLWLCVLDNRSRLAMVLLIVVCTVSVLFFIKTGFRYRLAWLALGLTGAYYLWKQRRPNLLIWVPLAALFVAAMGWIGSTRSYFAGVDASRAQGMGARELLTMGFQESAVFFSVCQVVDAVPSRVAHTYFDPIYVALTYPIPRYFWPKKPTSSTLASLADSFGGTDAAAAGLAVPFYGEWYIAFGWPGLVLTSALFGFGAKKLWLWYIPRSRDKLVTVIYAVALGFFYVAFSRGFLAQVFLNFAFALLPMMVAYRLVPKMDVAVARWARIMPGIPSKNRGRPSSSHARSGLISRAAPEVEPRRRTLP